eukprot:TRINITY_DN68066_c5_g12_i1.p2 TRINITY_DN68066_c5_g12~~TRINITY_DN68066_c5_g12_i1.p2  ORF type:complete len:133 (+),score=2.19 TRINITY_DN68066_c5_g12_i1:305-703(+)
MFFHTWEQKMLFRRQLGIVVHNNRGDCNQQPISRPPHTLHSRFLMQTNMCPINLTPLHLPRPMAGIEGPFATTPPHECVATMVLFVIQSALTSANVAKFKVQLFGFADDFDIEGERSSGCWNTVCGDEGAEC